MRKRKEMNARMSSASETVKSIKRHDEDQLNEYTGRMRGKLLRVVKSFFSKQIRREKKLFHLLFSGVFYFVMWKMEVSDFGSVMYPLNAEENIKWLSFMILCTLYMTAEVCQSGKVSPLNIICVRCTWWQNMRKSESERFKAAYIGDFFELKPPHCTQGSKASQLLTMLNTRHKRQKGFTLLRYDFMNK